MPSIRISAGHAAIRMTEVYMTHNPKINLLSKKFSGALFCGPRTNSDAPLSARCRVIHRGAAGAI